MKNRMMLLAALAGALMLSVGCSSLQTSPKNNLSGVSFTGKDATVAHINATVEGWYLLFIPLMTGAAEKPGAIVFGEDTCNVKTAVGMVTAQAKKMNAKYTFDVVSTRSSSLFLPIPYLFRWKTVTVSGNAAIATK